MSAAPSPSVRATARRLILPALCGLLLALAMIRLPVVTDVEPLVAYRTLLYETLRLGRAWSEIGTTEGPLGALQTPTYLGGSIWMAVTWQVAGSLLLAGVLVAAAFRLPWSRRGWALAVLAVVLSRWPACASWLVMTLLGYDLIRDWSREPRGVVAPALLLGFLSLFSLGHLLLGLVAVTFLAFTARPPLARATAILGLGVGLVGGWLLVGQSLPELFHWLQRGLPLLADTSPFARFTPIGPMAGWAAVATIAFLGLALHRGATFSRPGIGFLLAGAWLAWKTVVLQAHGDPAIFFSTIILGSFILWPSGARAGWSVLPALLAVAALAGSQPGFIADALGHFNRQAVFSARQLIAIKQLRPALGAQVRGLRQGHAWPQIQAAVGTTPVGILGDALPRALLNNLTLAPSEALLPAFVIQSLPASAELAPALENSPAQFRLYRYYELQFAEKGFLLWRRKPGSEAPPTPLPVTEGILRFGEALPLPPAQESAYRLELGVQRSWLGWLWSLVGEVPSPGLIVRDQTGQVLRYALPAEVAAHGFLVDPLIRGNVEFMQWHAGGRPVRTVEFKVAPPAGGSWLWRDRYTYRLTAVPNLALAGHQLSAGADWHTIFNRLPVGTAQSIPFGAAELAPGDPVLFAHPTSIVEFAVSATDRRVHGSLGLLPGAYQGASTTDGVDFSVEFIGDDGVRQVLYHRYLNPRDEIADQGTQYFTVTLPEGSGGRLLLRVWNPPYRTAAWDWAFWRNVVIE